MENIPIDEQYNCEVTDYIAGYIKIDTSEYLNNDNLLTMMITQEPLCKYKVK